MPPPNLYSFPLRKHHWIFGDQKGGHGLTCKKRIMRTITTNDREHETSPRCQLLRNMTKFRKQPLTITHFFDPEIH